MFRTRTSVLSEAAVEVDAVVVDPTEMEQSMVSAKSQLDQAQKENTDLKKTIDDVKVAQANRENNLKNEINGLNLKIKTDDEEIKNMKPVAQIKCPNKNIQAQTDKLFIPNGL